MILTPGLLKVFGKLTLHPTASLASDIAGKLAGFSLHAISSWVLHGTSQALSAVAGVIGNATAPNLDSTWFSSVYWRVAALAAMLTLPFLFAAAVQALVRSDLALLARAAFGYLPLSLLAVGLAAPVTMLLLAATDEMSSAVGSVGIGGGAQLIDRAALAAATFSASTGSLFFVVIVGMVALLASIGLMLELLMREAAVYVVVLMLPLAFAAMVWPARRIWAVRMVEILTSLILSKFVIVAVLSLAGAAFAHGIPGVSVLLVAMALLVLSLFSPWALMRLLPFAEIGAGAAGMLHREAHQSVSARIGQAGTLLGVDDQSAFLAQHLRRLGRGGTGEGAGAQAEGFPDSRPAQSGDSTTGPGAAGPLGTGPARGVAAEAGTNTRTGPAGEAGTNTRTGPAGEAGTSVQPDPSGEAGASTRTGPAEEADAEPRPPLGSPWTDPDQVWEPVNPRELHQRGVRHMVTGSDTYVRAFDHPEEPGVGAAGTDVNPHDGADPRSGGEPR